MSYPFYFVREGFAARRLFSLANVWDGGRCMRVWIAALLVGAVWSVAATEVVAATNAQSSQSILNKSLTTSAQAQPKSEHSVLGPYGWAKAGEVPDYFGAVLQGQSLWRVARRLNGALGVSVEQVAIGLYEANPEAFSGGSIHALQAGSYLRIPSLAEVKTYSHAAAKAQLEIYMGKAHAASVPKVAGSVQQNINDADTQQLPLNVNQAIDAKASAHKNLQSTAGHGDAETPAGLGSESNGRESPQRIEAPTKVQQVYWVWMVLPASLLTLFIVLWRTRRPVTPATQEESQRQDAADDNVEPVHVKGRSRNGSVVKNGGYSNQTDFSKLRSRRATRHSEREPVAGVTLEEFSESSLPESKRVEPKLWDEDTDNLPAEEEVVLSDVVEPSVSAALDEKHVAALVAEEQTDVASDTVNVAEAKQNLGSADQHRETWTKNLDTKLLKAQQHRESSSEFDQELTQLIIGKQFAAAKRLLDSSRGEALDEPHYHYQRLRLMYEAEDEHSFYEYLNRVEHKLKSADPELQAKLDKLQTLLN